MALPQLTGTARLTAEPELRFAPSGIAVCSMHLAFNSRKRDPSRKQDPSGTWTDGDSLFIKATAFKDLAEHCKPGKSGLHPRASAWQGEPAPRGDHHQERASAGPGGQHPHRGMGQCP